jgi:hypothetical protein
MIGIPADSLIQQTLEELQDDPRELRRYKDFSLYADLLPFIPTNIKAFVQSQLGIDRDFTELDLTNKEIAELDRMIFEQGLIDPSKIDYPDYSTGSGYSDITRNVPGLAAKAYKVSTDEIKNNPEKYNVSDPQTGESITLAEAEKKYPGILSPKSISIKDFSNPAFNLKTFLGKADVLVDEKGNLIIEDTYNFGSPKTNIKEKAGLKGVGLGDNPVYEAARRLPLYNPLNTEYSVNLNLGTREDYEKRKARQNKAVGGFVESGIAIQNILNEI